MKYIFFLSLVFTVCSSMEPNYYMKADKKITLIPINESNTKEIYRKYKTDDGNTVMTKNTLFVTLKDSSYLTKLLSTYKLRLQKNYGNKLYLLKSTEPILNTVNQLNKEIYILFASPNFYKKIDIR